MQVVIIILFQRFSQISTLWSGTLISGYNVLAAGHRDRTDNERRANVFESHGFCHKQKLPRLPTGEARRNSQTPFVLWNPVRDIGTAPSPTLIES